MLTVPQAAKRSGRNPETIRRWIRSGRLRATKIGTQHVIEEQDLDLVSQDEMKTRLPEHLRRTSDGQMMPDVVELLHESRRGR